MKMETCHMAEQYTDRERVNLSYIRPKATKMKMHLMRPALYSNSLSTHAARDKIITVRPTFFERLSVIHWCKPLVQISVPPTKTAE